MDPRTNSNYTSFLYHPQLHQTLRTSAIASTGTARQTAVPSKTTRSKKLRQLIRRDYLTSRTRDSIQTGLAVLAVLAVLASSAGRSSHSRFPHRARCAFVAGFAVRAGLSSNSCAASQRSRPPINRQREPVNARTSRSNTTSVTGATHIRLAAHSLYSSEQRSPGAPGAPSLPFKPSLPWAPLLPGTPFLPAGPG